MAYFALQMKHMEVKVHYYPNNTLVLNSLLLSFCRFVNWWQYIQSARFCQFWNHLLKWKNKEVFSLWLSSRWIRALPRALWGSPPRAWVESRRKTFFMHYPCLASCLIAREGFAVSVSFSEPHNLSPELELSCCFAFFSSQKWTLQLWTLKS